MLARFSGFGRPHFTRVFEIRFAGVYGEVSGSSSGCYSVEDDDDKRRPSVLGFLVKTPPREVFSYSSALAFTLSPLVGEPRN